MPKEILAAFVAFLAATTLATTSSAAGKWDSNSFFDNQSGLWHIVVTSTVDKTLDCTASWRAVQVPSGSPTEGTAHFLLSPYPGFGAPIKGEWTQRGLGNLTYTMACNQ
jgi:hypothetical protein